MRKKVLIIHKHAGIGIKIATKYLIKYLSRYYEVYDFELLNCKDIKSIFNLINENNIKNIIVHDVEKHGNLFKQIRKNFDLNFFYFVPAYVGVEKRRNFKVFDCTISGSDSILKSKRNIKWVFDIPTRFKSQMKFNERKNTFLYCGRINEFKLDPVLIDRIVGTPYKLDIFGYIETNEDRSLLDNYKRRSIDSNVIFHNPVKNHEIENLYNQYKFIALASNTDVFSLFSLEAACCGCIPIIYKREGVVFPWLSRLTKEVNSAKDMVSAYEALLHTPNEQLQDYSDAHRKDVKEKLKNLSNIDKIDSILQ